MVFQWLARNWLQNVVRQKIRDKVVEAAQSQLAAAASDSPAAEESSAPQRPCDVGAVFALEIESGGLEDLLEGVVSTRGHGFVARQGGLKGRHVVLVRSGAGRSAAAKATEALIAGHRPRWVFSAGFAGGLSPRLSRGDIVIADSVVDTADHRLTIDLQQCAALLAEVRGVHVGRLLTADRIIRRPEEKRELGQKYDALAVDMESFAVAEVCSLRQVPFLAVRVIHDALGDVLPRDVDWLIQQKSHAAQLGAALGAIVNRPSSLKDLLKLKEAALLDSDHLAKFLAGMIQRLVQVEQRRQ